MISIRLIISLGGGLFFGMSREFLHVLLVYRGVVVVKFW